MKNNQNISESSINSDRQIADYKRNNSIQTEVNEILQVAVKYQRANRLLEAEKLYHQVLKKQPKQPEALYKLGMLAQQLGQPQRAEQLLIAASQVQPDSVKTWFSLGNLRLAQEQFSEAETAYQQAIALHPNSVPIYNNLGYTLQKQGKFEEAIACYQKALDIEPNCTEADVNWGNALHAQGKLSTDKQLHYARLNHKLGDARKQAGDLKNAVAYYRQAIALQPDLVEAHYRLGVVLQEQGELEEAIPTESFAIACYQKALELNPNYGDVYLSLGKIYQDQKNLKEAISAYRQGLELINPHYAVAVAAYQGCETAQEMPTTPPIPQEEVIVGEHRFPAIPSVADNIAKLPFWSVVIPAYNRTDYLLECLVSVLAQWQEEMEIIVIDDASTTPLFELVKSIGQGIISYYRNPQNLRQQGTWNAGVFLTRGQWVHLLHDDDYVLPGFYNRLKESLENCPNSVGAAFTGYENINDKRKVVFRQQLYGKHRGIAENFLQKIGVANPLNPPAVVIRRATYEQLGGYHPELTATLDWELYKRIASFYDWWCEPEILVHYRQHSQSMRTELLVTGTRTRSIRRSIEISKSYLPQDLVKDLTAKARQYYFASCLEDTTVPLKAGNMDGAICMVEEALKIDHSPQAIAKLFSWLREDKAVDQFQEAIPTERFAIACYQKVLEINPHFTETYFHLGKIYQNHNNLPQAISAYQQGLKLTNPQYCKALKADTESGTAQEVPVTPPLPQGEVIVGNYKFPQIPPVAAGEDKRPFWSVIIPVYNRTSHILECLASVLAQWTGAEEMEILVMDNASTPPLFDLVNSIGKGIVRYYRNSENLGLIGNHNAGIALSRGQWIHILHDDDYVLPGFYSQLKQSLDGCSDSIGMAFTGFENINDQGVVVSQGDIVHWYGEQKGIIQNWLSAIGITNPLRPSAIITRRATYERLGGYCPELTDLNGWELCKRIASFYDCWYEPGILARYRLDTDLLTNNSLSKNKMSNDLFLTGNHAVFLRRAIEIPENYLPTDICAEITAKARSYNFKYLLERRVIIPLKAGCLTGALRMLQEALKIDRSPQAVAKLFDWLTTDEATPLREEIISKLISLPVNNDVLQT